MEQSESNSFAASWRWISRVSGLCSLILVGILLVPVINGGAGWLFHLNPETWLDPLSNNWLILVIKLHAGLISPTPDPLVGFNLLDFIILFLVNEVIFGLGFPLLKMKRWWTILALIQPLIGMVLFAATQQAGRSSVMGSILVVCIVQMTVAELDRGTSWLGILGSILLLAGDISGGTFYSLPMAYLTALGYILLTTWFVLVSMQLFHPTNTFDLEGT